MFYVLIVASYIIMCAIARKKYGKIDHPLDRHSEIVGDLIQDIVRGHYPPTSRLPRWRELTARYKTTLATVQKALERLEEYGYIQRGGWHGIRVVEFPPHRFNFGLVFTDHSDSLNHFSSHFKTTLAYSALQLNRIGPRRITLYQGVQGDREEQFRELAADLNARRVAGLILTDRYMADGPHFSTLQRASKIPVAALLAEVKLPETTRVLMRTSDFMERACAYLQAHGRRRVALVSSVNAGYGMWSAAHAALAAHGLETHPWLRIDATILYSSALRPVMQMLCRLPANDRPDAIIITDDNLVPDATAGLAEAGIRVPEDLTIVAHANFPLPTPSAVPVARLGFDVQRVLTTCLDALDQRIQGAKVPEPVIVPAEFEEEIKQNPK